MKISSWVYRVYQTNICFIMLQTALHMVGSHENVATILLEHGAESDINEQNRYGEVSMNLGIIIFFGLYSTRLMKVHE